MWEIEYSDEAKYYFIDNDPYTFDLLVKIEELRYTADGIPPAGCTMVEPGLYLWEVLNHLVYYRRRAGKLVIAFVQPQE